MNTLAGLVDLSQLSESSSSSLQWIFTTRKESEQELPVTPKAGLTPRASFSNLMFGDAHETCVNDQELPPSSPSPSINLELKNDPFNGSESDSNLDFSHGITEDLYDRKPILLDDLDSMPWLRQCRGQPVEWTPGSVWDSYAYQMHDDDSLPWNLIRFQEGNFIIIQSRDDCAGSLFSDKERDRGSCNACFSLLNSDDLRRFISRAHQSEAKSHTPWKYLNHQQLAHLLVKSRSKVQDLHLKVRHSPICLIRLSQSESSEPQNVLLKSISLSVDEF